MNSGKRGRSVVVVVAGINSISMCPAVTVPGFPCVTLLTWKLTCAYAYAYAYAPPPPFLLLHPATATSSRKLGQFSHSQLVPLVIVFLVDRMNVRGPGLVPGTPPFSRAADRHHMTSSRPSICCPLTGPFLPLSPLGTQTEQTFNYNNSHS
ncbi:hypothetical protein T02_2808 [Trichinella nativa]|uniref:Uncharacterized protein n=1 Tax=Trichinella nativa TaxID=6335 RepID=A0A0V1KTW5_9BILA|nr:hypothetical protein T02_2808 [Trichinella nativa]